MRCGNRVLALALTLATLAGCGDDGEGESSRGALCDSCSAGSACNGGLVCGVFAADGRSRCSYASGTTQCCTESTSGNVTTRSCLFRYP